MSGQDFSEIFRRYKEALGNAQQSEGKSVPGGGNMFKKLGFAGIVMLAIILFFVISASVVIVGPGKRGVLLNFGAVSPNVYGEGLHFKIPGYQTVIQMDVQVQKVEREASAASKDLQDISSTIAVNYNIIPDKVAQVFQRLGMRYQERVIDPAIHEAVKAVTARYTAAELVTNREKVRSEIKDTLASRMLDYNILVVDVSIVNFAFSAQFNQSVENKNTAEQLALKAQRDLDRIKIEAQQKIAQAQAEAEALRLQRQNITPELVELRRIEAMQEAIRKWNGVMPNVTGGAMPFIDAKAYNGRR
ncbi:MAG: prohibitin family protein [Syntrophorhabdaceae bacterium]|nr:prohibitin family protein [Syntrophorhabdaceae bacterium]